MKLFGLTARVLASVLVFGVLTPMLPATAALSPVISPAAIQSAAAAKAAPKNTKAPTISGTTRVPNQLSVTNGTWSGAPTSYTYQWFRCNAAVKKASSKLASSCSTISSATVATYTLTDADAGKFMVARVSGVNVSGTVSIHSASTVAITPRVIAPKNTVAATISGTAQVSRVLTTSTGTWIENPTDYLYQWMRCKKVVSKVVVAKPSTCVAISGETDERYQVVIADKKKFISVAITSSNIAGTAVVHTKSTAAVQIPAPYLPTVVTPPSLNGSPLLQSNLNLDLGVYEAFPAPTVEVEWFSCPDVVNLDSATIGVYCDERESPNEILYEVGEDDLGEYVVAKILASNDVGQVAQIAMASGVAYAPPRFVAPPSISGNEFAGAGLSANQGTLIGYPVPEYSRRWVRCEVSLSAVQSQLPEDCQAVAGETSVAYTLTEADVGKYLALEVTSENEWGSALAISTSTDQIGTLPTLESNVATLDGQANTGFVLSASATTWDGQPSPSLGFEWYRCLDPHLASEIVPDDCSRVSDESDDSFQLDWSDSGYFLGYRVTATNRHGSESRFVTTEEIARPPSTIISSGYRHTCVRAEGVHLRCWGLNNTKQVGNDASSIVNTPITVPLEGNVQEVAVGYYHSCALTSFVWCWGDNFWGSLGDGSQTSSATPLKVPTPNLETVSSGSDTVCATDSSPKATCWGRSDYGQVGNRETTTKIPNPTVHEYSSGVQAIDIGYLHSCHIVAGLVYCVGYDGLGALGDSASHTGQYSVRAVRAGSLTNMVGVAAGYGHTCAWGGNELRVYCWGDHSMSQLGMPSGNLTTPGGDVGLTNVVKVEAKFESTCALTEEGAVYCWGANQYGQLGIGTVSNRDSPQLVYGIENAFDISVGEHFACAAIAGGTVKCWGRNNQGQISISGSNASTPIEVPNLSAVG
jgi:alpha-tubulin suppressor-like RCC1 family protein